MKQVVGVIIRKGFPHPPKQDVFWARIAYDGQVKVKSRRMAGEEFYPPRLAQNDMPKILPLIQNFVAHPGSIAVNEPMLCKTAPIDYTDTSLELLPAVYLDSPIPSNEELGKEMERIAREIAAYLVRLGKEQQARLLDENG